MKDNNQTSEDNRDSGILSSPISILRSGLLGWNHSSAEGRGIYGLYWSPRSYTTTYAYDLYFHNLSINFNSVDTHGMGQAVRCVANPSPLSLILAIL